MTTKTSQAGDEEPPIRVAPGEIPRQLGQIVIGLVCLAALVFWILRLANLASQHPVSVQLGEIHTLAREESEARCGPLPNMNAPVFIEMVSSKELHPWLEFAANLFTHSCRHIQIKLVSKSDMEASREILYERLHPTIWAPADDFSLRLLEHRRQPKTSSPSAMEQVELAESALVLLIWEDRLRVLSTILREQKSNEGPWVRAMCALVPRNPDLSGLALESMTPGNWSEWYAPSPVPQPRNAAERTIRPRGSLKLPDSAELQSWGRVKIGHAMPSQDTSGLGTLYLMAYQYLLPSAIPMQLAPIPLWTTEIEPPATLHRETTTLAGVASEKEAEKRLADMQDSLRRWLRRCEAGIEANTETEQALADSFFHLGPARLDGVVIHEWMALPLLLDLDANPGSLHKMAVVYPKPTLVSHYPAVIFPTDIDRAVAAKAWLHFLRSKEMQEKLIEFGFRPASKEVVLYSNQGDRNQFLRLRRYGILPRLNLIEAPPPTGRTIAELSQLWQEATGRD